MEKPEPWKCPTCTSRKIVETTLYNGGVDRREWDLDAPALHNLRIMEANPISDAAVPMSLECADCGYVLNSEDEEIRALTDLLD